MDMEGQRRNTGAVRTLKALAVLMDGRQLGRSGIERRLGVSAGTARRVMDALQTYPGVEAAWEGRAKVLRYRDPSLAGPAAAASTVIAACVATSLASLFAGTGYSQCMRRVRDGLLRRSGIEGIPERLDRKFLFVQRGGEVAAEVSPHVVHDVLEAVLRSRRLWISYQHFDGGIEELTIEPWSVAVFDHQLYVVAPLADGEATHPYRVSRIAETELGDDSFRYPTLMAYNPSAAFRTSFGIFLRTPSRPVNVRLRLDPRWRVYAEHHRWHESQQVVDRRGHVEVRLHVRSCPELKAWILGFGADAEVVAPASLRREVAEEVRKLSERYGTRRAVRRGGGRGAQRPKGPRRGGRGTISGGSTK